MNIQLTKIVSGGQTGADRAGLDFAIYHNLTHGGWCPKGRIAEDGAIASQYDLVETPSEKYNQRTEWNVRDSDGTVIFTMSKDLSGGSMLTAKFAQKHGKPMLHIYPGVNYQPELGLLRFVEAQEIKVLNIAGSRASKAPEVYRFTLDTLKVAFDPHPSDGSWLGGPGEG